MDIRFTLQQTAAIFITLSVFYFTACSPSKRARRSPVAVTENVPQPEIKLTTVSMQLEKGEAFTLNIPEGYHIMPAYQGLKRLRFLTKSPDGRLFATDMHDLTDNRRSRIYIFENWDSTTNRFKTIRIFMQRLRNVNQVAFYKENGTDYIYIPETGKLTRYVYHAGDNEPSGKPEVIATFPAYGLSYKYGGWHLTRSLAFNNGKLYLSVGSSCNACIEKENVRATIMEMDPDGKNAQVFASGLRNSVGIKWVNNELWATGMGQDKLGLDKPDDIFTTVAKGQFFGWPYYYQYHGKVYADDVFADSATRKDRSLLHPSTAIWGFAAHSAPLGFDHFKGFSDPLIANSFLVALHGSTDVSLQRGNAIVRISPDGKYTPFISGFLSGSTAASRHGRPCDVMMNDEHSFFFTDDMNGVLYYVWK